MAARHAAEFTFAFTALALRLVNADRIIEPGRSDTGHAVHRRVPDGCDRVVHRLPSHACRDRPLGHDEQRRPPTLDTRGATVATAAAAMTDWLHAITRALHPLHAPPGSPAWNHAHLLELLGDGPRAEAAVLMAVRDVLEPRVVFTLRREDLVRHAGQVSFPGGRTDGSDADAVATALRESREEIALEASAVEPLGFLDRLETVSGFCVTPVVARLAGDAMLVPQPTEVAKIFEVPLSFLLDPRNLRQFEYRSHGEARMVYEYVGVEPRIWGATAAMLVNLMRRMKLMP